MSENQTKNAENGIKLEIEYAHVGDLLPYSGNAKLHPEKQVKQIIKSIRENGFVDPIGIWHNEVVEGHGRLMAAKEMGMDEVPVIRLDHLTDEQRRAYALIHNQLTMNTGFDKKLLEAELGRIEELDMEQFDFKLPELESPDPGYYGDERERTYKSVNLEEFDETRIAGFYQMPVIRAEQHVPEELVPFNYILSKDAFEKGVHFFIDDYQFERIWNDPRKYTERLAKFDCCLTPDFSLYTDMPIAMQIWNIYRSRLVGQILQDSGIRVIPTLSWSVPDSWQFCFDGIEPGGTVAVSSVGVMKDKDAQKIWTEGMTEAISRLHPAHIVMYGSRIDYDFKDIDVKYIKARKGWK